MKNRIQSYCRRVPPGFRSYEAWADELGSAVLSSGRAAFIFPNVHRRRQAEEYFLARSGHLPVRLFTPRGFAESLVPPSWVVAGKFGATLLLEKIIGEFRGSGIVDSPRFQSLQKHFGARRLLLDFFIELAAAGLSGVDDVKERLPEPGTDDRVWLALFEVFLKELDACQTVFGPMLETRLADWLAGSVEPLPYDFVRFETGCELDVTDQKVLEALAGRGVDVGIEIPLPHEPARIDNIPAWRPAAAIVKRLKGALWNERPAVETGTSRLRDRLLDPVDPSAVDGAAAGVYIHTGEPTPVDELHAASERIRQKLAAGAIAPQDAGIVLSDPYSLADRAENVARQYGLPVEVARARTVIETEAGRVARLLLEVLETGTEPEALVKFLSSPLVSWELTAGKSRKDKPEFITPRLVRDFDTAFDRSRAEGPARVWYPRLKKLADRPETAGEGEFDRSLKTLKAVEPVITALLGEAVPGTGDVQIREKLRRGLLGLGPDLKASAREFAAWVERALWNAWLPRRLSRVSLPEGEGSQGSEGVRRSFAGLTKLFDVLGGLVSEAEKLGIGERPLRNWAADLEQLLHDTPVPERVPSAKSVRVISPRDVPGLAFRHLEWVGLSERQFPSRHPDSVCGTASARRALKLDRAVPETELAWARLGLALLETDGEVHLSCPRRDGNDSSVLSSPVWMIRTKLGDTEPASVPHRLSLERQGAAWLSGFSGEFSGQREWPATARGLLFAAGTAEYPARLLAAEPELKPEAALELSASGRISSSFAAELAAMLTNRPLSASRLGEYAKCPFYYLASTRLKAGYPEERISGLTPLERGKLVHEVLEKFYSDPEVLQTRADSDWADKVRPKLSAFFAETVSRFDLVFHGEGWEIEKSRTRTLLDRFLDFEATVKDISHPVAVEFGFGRKDEKPFEWAGLSFSGAIDRVDEVPGQGFLIFDYKTGKKIDEHLEALRKGLGFQLPLYAAAASELLKDRLPGRWLGGGFYELRLPSPAVRDPLMPPELRGEFGANPKSRTKISRLAQDLGGLEKRYRDRAREIAGLALAGSFPTTPLARKDANCDRCHLRNVCHVNESLKLARNAQRPAYGVISEWDTGSEGAGLTETGEAAE